MSISDLGDNACCWRCGYNLYGFDEDAICSECGLWVLIARREAPLIIRSRAQKWIGILSLTSVVPFIVVGFVFYLAAVFAFIDHGVGMYGSVVALTLSSTTGVIAGWFMKVPKREFSVPAHTSLLFCAIMFLWLWPFRILIAESSMGSDWLYVNNIIFLIVTMCALGSLAIQAKLFARKTGMAGRAHRGIYFNQISYLAFVSAGLMAFGILLGLVNDLFSFPDRLSGMSIGSGMLLGILPLGAWMICLCPIIFRLARWPIGESCRVFPGAL